jgi:hypothetical protein
MALKRAAHLCPEGGHRRRAATKERGPCPGWDMLPPSQAELEWRSGRTTKSGGHRSLTLFEITIIFPHAVQDHGQFSDNRHLCATHAEAGGKCQPHVASVHGFGRRVSDTFAVSKRWDRSRLSPHFEICPDLFASSD